MTNEELTKLVAIVNRCVIDNNFCMDTWVQLAYEENIDPDEVHNCMSSDPPRIQFYNGQFYSLEQKVHRKQGGTTITTVMRDDRGEVFAIWSQGQVLWERK